MPAEFDTHHEPFDPQRLLTALSRVRDAVPGFQIGRSGNQTGNIAIYDAGGEYVGSIELNGFTDVTLWNPATGAWVEWNEETSQWE